MTDEKKPVKEEKAAQAKPAVKKPAAKKKAAPKSKAEKATPAKKAVPKKKAAPKTKAKKEETPKKTTRKPAVKKKAAPKAKEKQEESSPDKKKAPAKKTARKPAAKKKSATKDKKETVQSSVDKKKAPAKKTAAKKKPAKKAKEKQEESSVDKKKTPPKKTATKPAAKKKEAAKDKKETTQKKSKTLKTEEAKEKKKTAAKKPARKPKAKKEETPKAEEKKSSIKPEDAPKDKKEASSQKTTQKSQPRKQQPQKKNPAAEEQQKNDGPPINYKLLVNADEPEECRIALLENGKVESFNVETVVRAQTKGNIYKGIITAVEANLQAAFVDMGTGKNGFLPFSDIHPEYYCKDMGKKTHWKDLSIQSVVMKGQEVLVEVVKETTGNKGANLTTYLSMPGRYVVLMPGSDSHGISRKINNEERRTKLREIIKSANLPEEIGYIIRTASEDITKTALMKDIKYQLDLWKEIKHNGQTMEAPAIVYKEQNVVSRFLRDHYTPEINEIMVDNKDVFDKVNQFMEMLPAKQRTTKVKLHRGSKPIFNQFQVEEQIEQMYQPQVPLPSGGSIVIDPTEALVAIDVNSGRTSKDKNFEKTIFLANMEAADELARQLRLRDLGGLIVVDFIDMRDKKNIREVEKKLRTSLKKDKAKIDTSRISKFGLMQISRQRLGPPIQKGNYIKCEHCQGSGIIKSVETTSLSLLRRIQTGAAKRHIVAIECELPLAIAQYLLNQKRADIVAMEKKYRVEIRVISDPSLTPSQEEIRFIKKDS